MSKRASYKVISHLERNRGVKRFAGSKNVYLSASILYSLYAIDFLFWEVYLPLDARSIPEVELERCETAHQSSFPRITRQFVDCSRRRPLQSEDIAAAIVYAVTQPEHVSVNEILIRPTEQER